MRSEHLQASTLAESGFLVERAEVLTGALFPHPEKMRCVVPISVFNCLCWLTSLLKKGRQLRAVTTKPCRLDLVCATQLRLLPLIVCALADPRALGTF